MIHNIFVGKSGEEFLGTLDFGLFDGLQVQALHCSFCLGDKENMLHLPLVKCNCPIRGIIAHWSGDGEAFGQFCIDADFIGNIHAFSHTPLYTLAVLGVAIGEEIILHVLLSMIRSGKIAVFLCCEYAAVIFPFCAVVGNILHNHGGLFLIDEPDGLGDELLRVVLQHGKDVGTNTGQDFSRGTSG